MYKYLFPSLIVLVLLLSACGTDTSTTAITPTPTTKPTATQKPVKNAITGTTGPTLLGSPLSNYIGKYGPYNDHTNAKNGDYHFARIAGENTDSVIVQTDTFDGGVYAQKAMSVLAAAPESGWSVTQANAICGSFYPTDAKYKRQTTITTNTGYDKIYSSDALAKLFPADAFDDSNNTQTTRGSFDAQYLVRQDGTIDSCNVQIGTQQTS